MLTWKKSPGSNLWLSGCLQILESLLNEAAIHAPAGRAQNALEKRTCGKRWKKGDVGRELDRKPREEERRRVGDHETRPRLGKTSSCGTAQYHR